MTNDRKQKLNLHKLVFYEKSITLCATKVRILTDVETRRNLDNYLTVKYFVQNLVAIKFLKLEKTLLQLIRLMKS